MKTGVMTPVFRINELAAYSDVTAFAVILRMLTENGRKNTAAKQPSSWLALCGYHISKVT